MEVKKLVCDVCGGQIEMQSGGKGVCTSCGTPYSAEIIKDKIQEIRGTVKVDGPLEVVKGNSEKERQKKNILSFLEMGDLYNAKKILNAFTNEFPDDSFGWYMLGKVMLQENYYNDGWHGEIEKYFNMAIHLNKKLEEKIAILKKKHIADIVSGKIISNIADSSAKNFYKEILDLAQQNARKLSSLHQKHGSYLVRSVLKDFNIPTGYYMFYIGNTLILETSDFGYKTAEVRKIPILSNNILELENTISKRKNDLIKNKICLVCGDKINLFGICKNRFCKSKNK